MTDREKILKGLAACLPANDEDAELNCGDCPYECRGGQDVHLPIEMIEDIRRVLKAQEPKRREEFDVAIDYLREQYERAQNMPHIHKPLAWALYQTWRWVDEMKGRDD